jgi:asparagine synthase (glutamine-hydrolysing)
VCGFICILDFNSGIHPEDLLKVGNGDVLSHRGPDDFGSYFDSTVVMLHRRLSIIDITGGKQPVFNEEKTCVVVFNGEIYNYKELQVQLIQKGHVFKSNSDTEVIIHAYEQWGEGCVDYFRGMFSFVIWDILRKKIFAVRDRLGIKPLFYAQFDGRLILSSEIKGILEYSNVSREMDSDAVAAYFSLSYIPAPLTIFKHIKKLPAGYSLNATSGMVVKIRKYWDVFFNPDYGKPQKYFEDKLVEHFWEATKLRLVSDVPVGAFLSGGIDSGMVTAAMSAVADDPVRTFSMGFGGEIGGYLDERQLARLVANRYRTHHQELEAAPNVTDILADIVRAFDEPFADDTTIPSYYLYKAARKELKVCLSGLGGDELFGGYERYLGFKLSRLYNAIIPKSFSQFLVPVIDRVPERADGHYTINHLKRFVRAASLPGKQRYWSFISTVDSLKNSQIFVEKHEFDEGFRNCRQMLFDYYDSDNAKDPLDKVFYCDLKTYLPEDVLACTDRMSMMHSLEVRVPFVDHKLVEFSATIPNSMKIKMMEKKFILKKIAKNYLPKSIFNHRKQGFSSPMTQWIRNDLRDYINDTLVCRSVRDEGIFNVDYIKTIITQHNERQDTHDKLIWALIVFQSWYNMYGK